MQAKYAVRFILLGRSRTYVVADAHTIDAIIQALDLLECDIPEMADAPGLAMVAKAWPDGAYLADEGQGVLIDTTRRPRVRMVYVCPECGDDYSEEVEALDCCGHDEDAPPHPSTAELEAAGQLRLLP